MNNMSLFFFCLFVFFLQNNKWALCTVPSFHLCCANIAKFYPIIFHFTQSLMHSQYFKEMEGNISKALNFDS